MSELEIKIQQLEARLEALVRTQIDFQKEVTSIRAALTRLRARQADAQDRSKQSFYVPPDKAGMPPTRQRVEEPPRTFIPASGKEEPQTVSDRRPTPPPEPSTPSTPPRRPPFDRNEPVLSSATRESSGYSKFASAYTEKARENLEEFVGKNLISLIGIVVLVLGVGIGAKYAIDNNLISPLTRIILGYGFGFALVGLAIKFKSKYHGFSAVLISGGMAIMYFVTYFAYSAYGLLSQLGSFGLMVMFTIFTVAAAIAYNRQVIAHIGLVGAYAVPFLLSDDSGNYLALFGYMTVINTGILAISVKKAWKPIFYTASAFTWLIFAGWVFTKYQADAHFNLAIIFLGIFFAIFFAIRIVHERFADDDSSRMENLVTAFATVSTFYGFCYALLHSPLTGTRAPIFFTFLAISTIAILITALKKGWEQIFYPAAGFAWFILGTWLAQYYSAQEHFSLALIFLGIFFSIFYVTKVLQRESQPAIENRAGAIVNGVVFYSICFGIANSGLSTAGYWTTFTYIAAASIAILATSFRFYGRIFLYLVVPATWLIFGIWFASRYDATPHFALATTFSLLFFATFYFSIIYERLVEDSFTLIEHTSLILSNAFVFFGFGYAILDRNESLSSYVGLFTVANAALHLIVASAVGRIRRDAIDVVQVLTVLILTFTSIAIPIQFDGNLVTIIWATEGAVLFWFGRTRAVKLFEYFSLPVIALSAASLTVDWLTSFAERGSGIALTPIANGDFITAIVFVTAFAFIYITNRDRKHEPAIEKDFREVFGYLVAAVGLVAFYNMFRVEIDNYFFIRSEELRDPRRVSVRGPVGDLETFNRLSQIDYTLLFFSLMAIVNLRRLQSVSLSIVNVGLGLLAIVVFLTAGTNLLYELRVIYVAGSFDPAFVSSWMYIGARHISYVIAIGLLIALYFYRRDEIATDRIDHSFLEYAFDAVAYSFFFIVSSAELLNLAGQWHLPDGTKLGLSILWGVFAILMVVIGIARDKKHLRIAAMVLLFATLAKLFLYDIAELPTIQRTILFVTLGVILLVVSFLYNKYKNVIFKMDPDVSD